MDELISRQAAIEALDGEIEVTGKANAKAVIKYTKMVSDRIKALPPAQPDLSGYSDKLWKAAYERGKAEAEPRWIPVTERLPEENGLYLVTVEGSQNGEVFERAVDYADFMFSGGYIDNFNTVNDWIEYGEWHVTAWMPLPDPYKEASDD